MKKRDEVPFPTHFENVPVSHGSKLFLRIRLYVVGKKYEESDKLKMSDQENMKNGKGRFIFTMLVSFFLILSCSQQKTDESNADLDAYKDIISDLKQGYDRTGEAEIAGRLRRFAFADFSDRGFTVMLVFQKMREKVFADYPNYSLEDYENAHRSVGVMIFGDVPKEEALSVLIRENELFSAPAGIFLRNMYKYGIEGFEDHHYVDIRKCFEKLASDGVQREMMTLGEYYLKGIRVKRDVKRGIELLERSKMGEAYILLADYYLENNDDENLRKYLLLAAERDMPIAFYNLGVLDQRYERYESAIQMFEKTLSLDENFQHARLELARMYVEEWGVQSNATKGAEMMIVVSQEGDEELSSIAHFNLGNFYRSGHGVEQSTTRAIEHYRAAADAGLEIASQALSELGRVAADGVE